MVETPDSVIISTRAERIAKLAKQAPTMVIKTLAHHLDMTWLREAHRRTRKRGAVGVDKQNSESYAQDLESNLADLLERAKSGNYRAPPVRRVHIPKGDGQSRPLGIPTFEDKVLQRAVAMLLEAVYEQDFLGCSYGFRPGRNAHQALATLRDTLMEMGGGWLIEVDVRDYFGTIDHHHLREALGQRIGDGVLLRLIGKWLNAGVMEDGQLSYPESGTPQGGVISPMLANVYLHVVLDTWFERSETEAWRQRQVGALRRRLRDRIRAGKRRTASVRGATEAIREIRSETAPKEDETGAIQETAVVERRRRNQRRHRARSLRLPRF
jgi:group II intron reverse transcriptase/maturase